MATTLQLRTSLATAVAAENLRQANHYARLLQEALDGGGDVPAGGPVDLPNCSDQRGADVVDRRIKTLNVLLAGG